MIPSLAVSLLLTWQHLLLTKFATTADDGSILHATKKIKQRGGGVVLTKLLKAVASCDVQLFCTDKRRERVGRFGVSVEGRERERERERELPSSVSTLAFAKADESVCRRRYIF